MDKGYLAHKFKLKPTKEQINIFTNWCHINRFVWNHFLAANQQRYKEENKFIFYYEMCYSLPSLKKEYEFLKNPQAQSLQVICQRLEGAIKKVWQSGNGFPHFKSKKRGDLPSIQIPQSNSDTQIKWTKKQIQIPKIGWIKWIKHRKLSGKLVSTTIKYEGGYWWIIALCETNKQIKNIDNDGIGIDLGLKDWVVTSDGEVFNLHPKLLEKEEQVKRQQRKLSHKVKESNNRAKQKIKLQRAHMKVKQARNDNAHKTSREIANRYSCVAMEDLNIKGMMKNRCLSRKIAQASWGQLKTYLSYKTNVKLVDRWYPSSQICSGCGHKQKMPLNIRTYGCNGCGVVINRDLNAAINIKQITFGTKENYACGDSAIGEVAIDASRYGSLKQEKFKVQDLSCLTKKPQSSRLR